MKPVAKVRDVVPFRFVCFPKELANRIRFIFTGKLIEPLIVHSFKHDIHMVPSEDGRRVVYHNVPRKDLT